MNVIVPFLAQGEDSFKCSGICTFSWFYIFSDVTKGVPGKPCIDALISQITDNALTIIIVGAGLVVSQLLGIIGSFMICCSDNSQCCGTGCVAPASLAKVFSPKTKAILKAQITTPMLVVIPQSQ